MSQRIGSLFSHVMADDLHVVHECRKGTALNQRLGPSVPNRRRSRREHPIPLEQRRTNMFRDANALLNKATTLFSF
ncbi:hypothetical protein [Bradyrhizobium viridifuturi]|uniref:hypothetical protein n=1 Tax=Bradyrhizobium viridifuturi TaxID=1654716 RepID=UPI000FE14ABA|nr:hypothetical protein [Bradyrhizobium viridifuturi]